jgi:transcription initiation factor IIE alpha subunit
MALELLIQITWQIVFSRSMNSSNPNNSKQHHYSRLVRLLVRMYYDYEACIIMDSFLLLDAKSKDKIPYVTDSLIAQILNLSINKVKPHLQKFRVDNILKIYNRDAVEGKNVNAATNFSSESNRRKGINKFNKYDTIYTIDYHNLSKVIKYKHFHIYQQLSKPVNKAEVFYICPTSQCPLHNIQRSVIDLLLEGDTKQQGFRCSACSTLNEKTGEMEATPLVPAASSTNEADSKDNTSNKLKDLFNKQIQPILAQLKIVDEFLEQELLHGPDSSQANKSAENNLHIVDNDNFGENMDSTIDVSIDRSIGGNSKNSTQAQNTRTGVAVDQAKGKVAELPWDHTENSLAQLEAQKLARLQANSNAVLSEKQIKEEEQKKLFDQQFQAELEQLKQNAADHNGNHSMLIDEAANAAAASDPLLWAGGKQIPLSQLTQADIEAMNEEEFSAYDSVANQLEVEFE